MAQVETGNNPNDPTNPNGPANQATQGPQGQTNQPTTSGGAGAVTATGAGNVTGQVTGTANPSQPFQNIASYLAANEPQSQQLAGQVAQTVSQPITQAQTGITNAANTFTGAVNAGFTPTNQDLISAVAANPSFVVGENPANVSNFLAQLKDTYTGPSDFTQSPGYADLETQIANAQGQAANTQTPQGIQTLLNAVEGPTTAGINKLDSLLLTNNPANITNIQAAGAPAAALTGNLSDTTAAQNALAAQGASTASSTAASASQALQDALNAETGNLTNEQNTIQGIVNAYNNSVGIINPVTSTIASDIQNFLAANPNIKLNSTNDVLAPLENLQSIAMPGEATYASPYDYQTIAALASLGIDPSALANLPIQSATANEAQTFNIPTALQNAVGQAPGVESALSNELGSFSSEIQGAYQPYQDLLNAEMRRYDTVTKVQDLNAQLDKLNQSLRAGNPTPDQLAQQKDLQTQISTLEQSPDYVIPNYWPQLGQMAQGIQWLPQASTQYNDLVNAINAELGKLGNVGVPSLNYAPMTVTDPVTGAPIGQVAKDTGNAAAIAGGTVGAASAVVPSAEGIMEAATSGIPSAMGGLSLPEAIGPAALAAYGTSNLVQNAIANPLKTGLTEFANMTLGLPTLPPAIFNSIGKDLSNVINSIGDFFGGLF